MQKEKMKNKLLCLGTAKLDDQNYGFSDNNMYFSAEKIILSAYKKGIKAIDTSPRYNKAETIIGKCLKKHNLNFYLSSKIENLEIKSEYSSDKMFSSINNSIKNLGVKKLNLCFLHQNELEIISDKNIMKSLKLLKEYNLVDEIGTSIYNEEELDFTLSNELYDWVQIPTNILDTYFYDKIDKFNSNIKIAARSIFLQGIIFQDHKTIQKTMKNSRELIDFIDLIKIKLNVDDEKFKQVAISFFNYLEKLSMIIIGSSCPPHIDHFFNSLNKTIDKDKLAKIIMYSNTQKQWSNPRNWN